MKDNITLYKIWAPNDAMWAEWAKPAMFFNPSIQGLSKFNISEIDWLDYKLDTMVIVDLEGAKSIEEGISLAKIGYRPIPLYNGVKGPKESLLDLNELERALYWGAEVLEDMKLELDARPVFLLDARRMIDKKAYPGAYDNRWCIFPQDMPSADYLINKGIKNIIVDSNIIRDDLSHILCRYQEKGINISKKDSTGVRFIKITKPSRYRSLKYRLKVILGLKRNSAGGFGGYVPDPSQYDSGTGYRGIG